MGREAKGQIVTLELLRSDLFVQWLVCSRSCDSFRPMFVRMVIVLNWMRRGRAHLFEGRLPFCSAVIGLEVLVPAMGCLPMVVADGGRIHRTMTSLPYVECIIKVLLRVALFTSAAFPCHSQPHTTLPHMESNKATRLFWAHLSPVVARGEENPES